MPKRHLEEGINCHQEKEDAKMEEKLEA